MATDISTLGVTYGVGIGPSALTTILQNATDIIDVTGEVRLNVGGTNVYQWNFPDLEIISSNGLGSFTRGDVEIVNVNRIEGLAAFFSNSGNTCRFPDNSTANGLIKNIAVFSPYIKFGADSGAYNRAGIVPNIAGLTLDGLSGSLHISGRADGVTFRNIYSHVDDGLPIQLTGSNNIIEYCDFSSMGSGLGNGTVFKFRPALGGYARSCKGNIVRYCTFSGGVEESIGFDGNGWQTRGYFEVTGVGADTVTLELIYGVQETFTGETDPLTDIAIGQHLLISHPGSLAHGNYYEVTGQSGSTLTLDTSTFSLAGLQVGETAELLIAFVENEYHNNTVNLDAVDYHAFGYGQHVGISLWSACLGNYVHHNTVEATGTPGVDHLSTGIEDAGAIVAMSNDPSPPLAYTCNSRNRYEANIINNCYHDILLKTRYYNEFWYFDIPEGEAPYGGEGVGKITDLAIPAMSYGIEAVGNTSNNPSALNGVHNVVDCLWQDNTLSAPSIAYDELYNSIGSPQPALGGLTGTTFDPLSNGVDAPASATTRTIDGITLSPARTIGGTTLTGRRKIDGTPL